MEHANLKYAIFVIMIRCLVLWFCYYGVGSYAAQNERYRVLTQARLVRLSQYVMMKANYLRLLCFRNLFDVVSALLSCDYDLQSVNPGST